jgi:hypothetical protein
VLTSHVLRAMLVNAVSVRDGVHSGLQLVCREEHDWESAFFLVLAAILEVVTK